MTTDMPNGGFTYQYAIRCPNGELLMRRRYASLNFSALLGLTPSSDEVQVPEVWDTREAAEAALESIRSDLKQKGIEWLAVVVQRLCTPFTFTDPGEVFAAEVQRWLSGEAS